MAVQFFFWNRPPYDRDLIRQAKALLDEGRNPLAVVLAQTACEVLTEQIVTALIERLDKPMGRWIRTRVRYVSDLSAKPVRTLYAALSRDEVQDQPFWPEYVLHVERRHHVVHRGLQVTPAEARRSYDVALQLIEHLEQVRQKLAQQAPQKGTP